MTRVRLRHDDLELLDAFAKTGSLARAAEHLGLTQPALSYRVKEAERRLGVELFVREPGRPVRLAAAAERLLPTASHVIEEVARAEDDISRLSAGLLYGVRLGVSSRACFDWLAPFLAEQRARHAELDFDLVAIDGATIPLALARGAVDVAIGLGPLSPAHVRARSLFKEEIVAVMAPDHPLTRAARIGPADFARFAYVTDESTSQTDLLAATILGPAGVTPMRHVHAGSPEAMFALISAGFGISLAGHRRAARHEAQGAVACRRIGARGAQAWWHVQVRTDEVSGTPASFVSDRMSYWCEARFRSEP